jgi:hypothetical protein
MVCVVLLVALGGCVLAGSSEKALVHSYRLAADESLKRVQADPVTPQWVKDSAKADHDALLAVDALFQGKSVADVAGGVK